MIEKMARTLAAIHHQPQYDYGNSSLTDIRYADKYWKDYARQARACLTALLEPDEGMVEAGWDVGYDHSPSVYYTAMIRAALEEKA